MIQIHKKSDLAKRYDTRKMILNSKYDWLLNKAMDQARSIEYSTTAIKQKKTLQKIKNKCRVKIQEPLCLLITKQLLRGFLYDRIQ